MARFLFATIPVPGHTNPALPIARALRQRGHEVRWYAGRKFRAAVEASGAQFLPMDPQLDYDAESLDAAYPGRKGLTGLAGMKWDIKHIFIDAIPAQVAELQRVLKTFPADAILADAGFLGVGALRGEVPPYAILGISVLTLSSRDTAPFGLALPPDGSRLGRLRNQLLNALFQKLLFRDVNSYMNRTRAAIGLPPLQNAVLENLSPYLHLQPSTPAFEYPRRDLPPQLHFIGPLLPDAPSDFAPPAWWPELSQGRPVVLVNQGTIATDVDDLILPALEALEHEDVLVVAATGGASAQHIRRARAVAKRVQQQAAEAVTLARLGLVGGYGHYYAGPPRRVVGRSDQAEAVDLPRNARIEPFIPFAALLPHVDVMITNGGFGGVQYALAHGVPIIVAGTTEEKPEIAARIAWSGAGINLKHKSPSPAQIRAAVRAIRNDPRYRQQAERIRQDYRQHQAPQEAVALLEELAATGQPVLREQLARQLSSRPGGISAPHPYA
jgi:UDP:flavonoid glycosyltransferase YjiC (YdhE family)